MNTIYIRILILFVIVLTCCSEVLSQTDLQSDIYKYRTGILIIKTSPDSIVKVTQLRHEFSFGTAINEGVFTKNSAVKKDRSICKL
jgi:hypothetical protein